MKKVTATEFARKYGQIREEVQHEPVAVTNHGRTTSYLISPQDFREYQTLRAMRREVWRVVDMPKEMIDEIARSRMDPKHNHLNKLLDE